MAFNDIFINIYALLHDDPSLVPSILGPRTVTNQRIYRAFPAIQSFFSTYEPNQPAEGWIVIEEPAPALRMTNQQYTTNHEYVGIMFHVYGTTYGVAHAALDVLDSYFLWTVDQQRDIQWGNRFLLFTRRVSQADNYDQGVKLYAKEITYAMEFVLTEDYYP